MRSLLYITLIISLSISCTNQSAKDASQKSDVISVESDDVEMNHAIEKAKSTFDEFDKAFRSGQYDTSMFSLKVRFETPKGGEHIWTYYIRHENDGYYGLVDQDAEDDQNIKRGQRVKVTMENLSDWMYADNGVLRGGYTIKVLRNKMNEEDKKSFDSTFNLRIVD